MAKNYVQSGSAPTFIAPAGGVKAGVPVALSAMVVVPLDSAAAGEEFVGHTCGGWRVACAEGLKTGDAVGLLDGALVAAATENAIACGKLLSDEAAGYVDWLLVQ